MKPLEEKINDLPKWAQIYIHVLQSELAFAKREIEQISGADKEGCLVSYRTSSVQANLPDRARVTFELSDKKSIEVHLKDNGGEKCLRLYAEWGRIRIQPEVTNIVDVFVVDLS